MVAVLTEVLSPLLQVWEYSVSLQGGLWLAVTIVVYRVSLWLNRTAGGFPLLHPLVITAVIVGFALSASGQTVADYQHGAGLLHWLLGPATVALALPMYAQWQKIRHLSWRLPVAVLCGGAVAPLLAWLTLVSLNAPLALQMTMLSKSITTPLAMETSRMIGGVPEMAAVFVILTGIVGAVVAPLVYRLLNIHLPQAQGLALGTVCHAIGTAKALQMGEQAGAMATLGLCLNGIMTAIILPLVLGHLVF